MLSRVSGSLVAAVVADCIGALYEGSTKVTLEAVQSKVERIGKAREATKKLKTEGGNACEKIKKYEFTDDTAMARSIAASLVDKKAFDVKDIARRFGEEYKKEPDRGYGGGAVVVLEKLADPDLKDIFQPAREQFDGRGSYGNGGAMRIGPLGLFCYKSDFSELKRLSTEVSALTHTHVNGINGAILQCRAVQLALSLDNTQPLDAGHFVDTLLNDMQPLEKEALAKEEETEPVKEEDKFPYCKRLQIIKEFLTRDVEKEEVVEKLGNSISALGSVPTAIYCFLKGAQKSVKEIKERNEVEQTIIYAISLGGDTDTIATMAAAIAGAFFGVEQIPEDWQEVCEGVDEAKRVAKEMVALLE